MIISDATWTVKYVARLRKVNDAAADKVRKYLEANSIVTLQDWNALIDYSYAVSTSFGEAAAAIACEFYDAVATASKAGVAAAIPAPTATYAEVAKSIRGTGKSGNIDMMANSVGRLVKMAGVDTTMMNAIRDGRGSPEATPARFALLLPRAAGRGPQIKPSRADTLNTSTQTATAPMLFASAETPTWKATIQSCF